MLTRKCVIASSVSDVAISAPASYPNILIIQCIIGLKKSLDFQF